MPHISPMLGKCDGLEELKYQFHFGKGDDRLSGVTQARLSFGAGKGTRELDSLPQSPWPRPGQVHFCAQTPRETPSFRLLTRRCSVLGRVTEAVSSLG